VITGTALTAAACPSSQAVLRKNLLQKVLNAIVRVSLRRGHLATGDCPFTRQSSSHCDPRLPDHKHSGWPQSDTGRGSDGSWHGALLERTEYDPQNGAPINSSLADYLVAVNADAPISKVHFLDYPDKEVNEVGARGIGEIGLAGIAAAITDAVHHATGVRVRELPVRIEDLFA